MAQEDSYSTPEDTQLIVFTTVGVLANDSDAANPSLTAALVTEPAHGVLTLNSDGSFTFTPATNYSGPDSFTYQASDGVRTSATATVSLTITPVNDFPIAIADSFSTGEDAALTVGAPGVLANDNDVESSLIAKLVMGTANGSVVLNTDGSFTYTPNANFNGTD